MTTLSDVCLNIVDCKNRTAPIDPSGDYFAVGTPAMRGNVINFGEARRINRSTFYEWTARMEPRVADLLLAREAPVGPVVMVPAGGNIAAGQRTILLRVNPEIADANYLRHYLISKSVQHRLLSRAHGSTTPHLRVGDIREFEVDLPSLNEQQAIAEVLGALDDKIAANTKLAATAEQLLRAEIDLHWLRLPERDSKLGDFVDLNPSTPLTQTAEETTYIDMKKLPESGWTISGAESRPAKGGARFKNGDTLLARITPCLENRKTGYVDLLSGVDVAVGSTEFIVLRARKGIPAPLSFLLATEPRFREYATQHMVGTSGRQRVSAGDLADFELPTPGGAWLANFGRRTASIFDAVRVMSEENRTLATIRDALLPQLMSGKLRVRDAEKLASEVGA